MAVFHVQKNMKACFFTAIATFLLAPFVVGFHVERPRDWSVKPTLWQAWSKVQLQSFARFSLVLSSKSDMNQHGINSDVIDPYAHLVESHPMDDPEPNAVTSDLTPLPGDKLMKAEINPYNIPTNPDEEWEWYYEKLKAREDDASDRNSVEESLLRYWMAKQRRGFMKTLGVLDFGVYSNWGTAYLPLERKQRLDAAGFYWGHLQPANLTNDLIYTDDFQRNVRLVYKDWIWTPMFEKLLKYKIEHGHTRVPLAQKDGLGAWTAIQRKNRSEMQERRRQRLDSLNFDWDWKDDEDIRAPLIPKIGPPAQPPKKANVPFPRRVGQLKEYRKTYGDCNVPLDYKDGLGKWVAETKKRRNELTPNSIRQLEKFGFIFDP